MSLPPAEVLHAIVARHFSIADLMLGLPEKDFFARYRGRLLGDSEAAFDQLTNEVAPYGLQPLFRKDKDGGQSILLVVPPPRRKTNGRISLNIVMFLLTLLSVMLAGAQIPVGTSVPADDWGMIKLLVAHLWSGWPFAVALLSILLAHEFGHYIAGRIRKVDVSLPFFIPLPFSILGTMGAFINMRSAPRNKRHLFDIGIAGPLAGLVVAIPVLLLGLTLSEVGTVLPAEAGYIEGNSLLYLLAKFMVFGQWLPSPETFAGDSPLFYWLKYFFTGSPVPYGGVDVFIHPIALAGWAGILVTSLNLIPAGQLDGGHILYTLFGDRLRRVLPVIILALGVLGFFWSGWWLWAVILVIFGRVHAEPPDQITELDRPRRLLAWAMIAVFLVTFSPVPMVLLQ